VTPFDIIHIAERLGQVTTGSPEADLTIHEALGLDGPVLRYTQEGWAARGLLPVGFEWMPPTYTGGKIYAGCRRSRVGGGWPHSRHGQWGHTPPLAMCGAAMRAYATLVKAEAGKPGSSCDFVSKKSLTSGWCERSHFLRSARDIRG
jgi:hypothetical protein